MTTGELDTGIAVVQLEEGQTPGEIGALRRAVAAGGPAFFPRHRWFGDKARTINRTDLVSVSYTEPEGDASDTLVLTVVEVRFDDGGHERYFLPLAFVSGGTTTAQSLARLHRADGQSCVLDDALGQPAFHRWLLDPATVTPNKEGGTGQVAWRPGPGYSAARSRLGEVSSRVSGAEQSNSAVIFGTELLAKVFRKLRPGLNPDIEISRVLSTQSEFQSFPELLGDLSFDTSDGQNYSIGMMLPFIPNYGDAWAYTLSILRDMLLGGTGAHVEPFHLLGARTGELHRALAMPTEDSAFAAEPVSAADIDGWTSALEQSIEATLATLRNRTDQLPLTWRSQLTDLSVNAPDIASRIQGFKQLEGTDKIRVHGDYHLGQVLVTLNHDFVILDFEGEPSRPMAERRAKTSPLKDVAGMLRSFSYARFAALREKPEDVSVHEATARLADWERQARSAFLSGYRSVSTSRGARYLPPTDDASFHAALAAWELDKAIYEVNYEINNRPDWLPLPLEALLGSDD